MSNNSVAIYGDSFAESHFDVPNTNWARLLEKNYGYSVDNYAHGGTGLDFSYMNFLKTHEKYKNIIFVASHIMRKSMFSLQSDEKTESLMDRINKLNLETIFGSYGSAGVAFEALTGKEPSTVVKQFVDTEIDKWQTYLFANDILSYNAMINHIKLLRPDVKIVYAFDTFAHNCFYNISQLDYKKFHTKKDDVVKRPNHISIVQNQKVAWNMHLWLQNEQDFNITISPDTVKRHYGESETMEEAGLK